MRFTAPFVYSGGMNPYEEKLASTDFLWNAIVDHLPKTSRSRTNYLNFDCPMCVLEGETRDTKSRCGITRDPVSGSIKIGCFNCGFSTVFQLGWLLPSKIRSFLKEIGLEEIEVNKLNFHASKIKQMVSVTGKSEQARQSFVPSFPTVELPADTHPITKWAELGLNDPDFIEAAGYAISRGGNVADKAHWSPDEKWKHRIIFPCYFRGRVVGWTGRAVKDIGEAKYLNLVPASYLSNCDVMNNPDREYLILAEGYLDGEAVDGISPFGAKLSPKQASWINESGKTVIVVPDRDKSGLPDHGLGVVLAGRPLGVGNVVEVGGLWLAVLALSGNQGSRAGLTRHRPNQRGWVGKHRGNQVSRSDLGTTRLRAHPYRVHLVQSKSVEHLENVDELAAEPVLEGNALGIHGSREHVYFLMLHVDALNGADVLWELE